MTNSPTTTPTTSSGESGGKGRSWSGTSRKDDPQRDSDCPHATTRAQLERSVSQD